MDVPLARCDDASKLLQSLADRRRALQMSESATAGWEIFKGASTRKKAGSPPLSIEQAATEQRNKASNARGVKKADCGVGLFFIDKATAAVLARGETLALV